MTSGGFLSTASVVTILACVALLAVASALVMAPLDRRPEGRRVVAFAACLSGVWILAVLAIALIKRTI
jgi:hypothetical protein